MNTFVRTVFEAYQLNAAGAENPTVSSGAQSSRLPVRCLTTMSSNDRIKIAQQPFTPWKQRKERQGAEDAEIISK